MVGADSDRYRPRRSKPPALGSAPSALPRLEPSLAPGRSALVEGLDDPTLSGRLRPAERDSPARTRRSCYAFAITSRTSALSNVTP